jgi:hypothetical protein
VAGSWTFGALANLINASNSARRDEAGEVRDDARRLLGR